MKSSRISLFALIAICMPAVADGPTFSSDVSIQNTDPDLFFVDTEIGKDDWSIAIDDNNDNDFRIQNDTLVLYPLIIESGAGTNLLFLDASERIGINTNLPVEELDIHSTLPAIRLNDTSAGAGQVDLMMSTNSFVIEGASGQDIATIDTSGLAGSFIITSVGDLSMGGGDLFVDSSASRVGINTNVPAVELDIRSPSPEIRLDDTSTNQGQVDLAMSVNSFLIQGNNAQNIATIDTRAPSPVLTIDSVGQTGIGTNNPTTPLDVIAAPSTIGLGNAVIRLANAGDLAFQLDNTSVAGFWNFSNANGETEFRVSRSGTGVVELSLTPAGDLTITGNLVTGGGGTCDPGPCDGVFRPDEYQVESIEDHAAYMWENQHLWGVGPTPDGESINLTRKTTGILHELEKAHIYIEQLNDVLKQKEARIGKLENAYTQKDVQINELMARLTKLEERYSNIQ